MIEYKIILSPDIHSYTVQVVEATLQGWTLDPRHGPGHLWQYETGLVRDTEATTAPASDLEPIDVGSVQPDANIAPEAVLEAPEGIVRKQGRPPKAK